jgi:uncharacterized protein (TIGR02231 family)
MSTRLIQDRSFAPLLALVMSAVPSLAAAAQGDDAVSRVVVYPDRAQVTRTATVACGDKVLARFLALPPAADASTVRAQIDLPGGRVLGVRTEDEVRQSAYSKQVEELDEMIRKIDLELAAISEQRARDGAVEALAARYEEVAVAQLGRELVDPPVAPTAAAPSPAQLPKAWAAAIEAPLKVRLERAAGTAQQAARERELRHRRDELARKRMRSQEAAARRELTAEVLVACPTGASPDQRAKVELTYLVGGAGFTPMHEARLADTGGAVEVSSYATITQRTGEDWKDAQVIVSTAIPRQNATPPEIVPLRVSATERTPPKKLLVSRVETRTHVEAAGSTADYKQDKGPGAPQLVEQGLSVQFVSQTPADILGDGTPARIRIARSELRGSVKYRAVPKLQPFVFRVADLVNTAGYPLLAGPVDVFQKGQFLSRYSVERVAAGERFQLSFGLVERMKVKRLIVEEIGRDKGLFGSTRRTRFAYRFEVENYLPTPEEIELSEHIPVSELDEVKVGMEQKATPGYELKPADGIVTYRLRLAPGEKRAIDLCYYVDAPASMLGE